MAALAAAAVAPAQELPGTPQGGLPLVLRDPYEAVRADAAAAALRRRPVLTVVPDLRFGVSASDNIFLTPDVLGFAPRSDGVLSVAPRLRALLRLRRGLGIIGDYTLNAQRFVRNGHAEQNFATLFLGYRPANDRHVEIGARGGNARISRFDSGDVNEGHGFVSGTLGWTPRTSLNASVSGGVRQFPERMRSEAEPFGIGPLRVPLPVPPGTVVERGQHDVVTTVVAGFSHAYASNGVVRGAYDFTDVDSDFSELTARSHRLSIGLTHVLNGALTAQLGYSLTARRFANAGPDGSPPRRDALSDLTASLVAAPARLRIPHVRSASLRLDAGYLLSASNRDSGDFDRAFAGLSVEIGLPPVSLGGR